MSSRRKKASVKTAIRAAASSSRKQPRSKTKKPKYLSLKLQLNHKEPEISTRPEPANKNDDKANKNKKKKKKRKRMDSSSPSQNQLINLFPLHPEETHHDPPNADIDDEIHGVPDDQNVAILLEPDAADTSTSLHGLLDSTNTAAATEEEDPSSPNYSLFRGGGGESHSHGFGSSADSKSFEESSSWLVRTAMRCRERDPSEERWVSYCQVVEEQQQQKKRKRNNNYKKKTRLDHDEVTSDPLGVLLIQQKQDRRKLVGLKLDYQEILDAWSDKGSLYIDNDGDLLPPPPPPQTVPDLQDSDDPSNQGGMMEDCENVWRVPEMEEEGTGEGESSASKEGYCWKQREASVLRYKEKRQNRLFAKRIRYQVRKLNAEKRPRLKGRFVKRIGE